MVSSCRCAAAQHSQPVRGKSRGLRRRAERTEQAAELGAAAGFHRRLRRLTYFTA